jgi:tRNA-dihydrouridine synthase A
MATPQLVAECVAAMRSAVGIPVTVKCRIGIDDQDEDADLQNFVEIVAKTGCDTFIIHARKAWLEGLSPKENREIPPLNYDRVHRLKASLPHLSIHLNGGLVDLATDVAHLADLDGLMYGRAAYHTPWMVAEIDPYTDHLAPVSSREEAVEAMLPYIATAVEQGTRLHAITRHMLGLYHGQPGGRLWRQILSTEAVRTGAGVEVVQKALTEVQRQAARREQLEPA